MWLIYTSIEVLTPVTHDDSCGLNISMQCACQRPSRAALKESLGTNNFPKGLTVQIQPHILEPDPVVLAEWNTAHMDFTKTLIQTLIRH